MTTIHITRVKGRGQGSTIGFPTINSEVAVLPEGITIGLWAAKIYSTWSWSSRQAIVSISKSENGFRLESHILQNANEEYKVGDPVNIKLLFLLRGHKKITPQNREKVINDDKEAGIQFFKLGSPCQYCKFSFSEDYGYSNYTVEGTNYSCLKKQFKESEDSDILLAQKYCEAFEGGDPWCVDVEHENPGPTDEWLANNGCERP